jgi:signal peptide peptidase SppA
VKTYAHILRAVRTVPWAVMPDKLRGIVAFLNLKISGGDVSPELRAELARAAAARSSARTASGVAIIPLVGLVTHRTSAIDEISGPGMVSTQKTAAYFRQAMADPNVGHIILDVDSPGGTVAGVEELAAEIFKARGQGKKITAVANTLMASAAYWIASQADEIVASPTAFIGSVGVYFAHDDDSAAQEMAGHKITIVAAGEHKAELEGPLTDEARAYLQSLADAQYEQFTKAIARGRQTTVADVKKNYGGGRVFTAADAVKIGMADRVGTLDGLLQKLGAGSAQPQQSAAADAGLPELSAAEREIEEHAQGVKDASGIEADLDLLRRKLALESV